jgi:alpha-L-fucosidase
VQVLETVGTAIKQAFAYNLATNASFSASSSSKEFPVKNVADLDATTCWMPASEDPVPTVTLAFDSEQTFNRILLQEQIRDHSQRIAHFAVDAWINNEWQEVASDTVVGYKRICRTATTTTSRVRVRVLESRLTPTVSEFGLYFDTSNR